MDESRRAEIEEEERVRAETREQIEKEDGRKGFLGCIGLLIVIAAAKWVLGYFGIL